MRGTCAVLCDDVQAVPVLTALAASTRLSETMRKKCASSLKRVARDEGLQEHKLDPLGVVQSVLAQQSTHLGGASGPPPRQLLAPPLSWLSALLLLLLSVLFRRRHLRAGRWLL
jgi:hypothetical protein